MDASEAPGTRRKLPERVGSLQERVGSLQERVGSLQERVGSALDGSMAGPTDLDDTRSAEPSLQPPGSIAQDPRLEALLACGSLLAHRLLLVKLRSRRHLLAELRARGCSQAL